MKKGNKGSRIGIIALVMCIVFSMMPLGVWAEGAAAPFDKVVSSLKAFSSYNGVQLEWKSLGSGYTYKVYEGSKLVGSPAKNKFFAKVSNEKKHTYKVYAVRKSDGAVSSQFVKSEAKTKVLPIKYKCVIKSKVSLNCHTPGHNHKGVFKPGKVIIADAFRKGCYEKKINGHQYRFKRIRFKSGITAKGYYNAKDYYTPAEMTRYVNKRGLSSKTNRLIVVSTKGQHMYLFKGSKGKWKLDRHWMVSTGSPKTPTPTGVYKIKEKWRINHSLSYWSQCGTFGLHSKASQWKLGAPKSGGCVRNTKANAKYIYYNYKVKTTVCIV